MTPAVHLSQGLPRLASRGFPCPRGDFSSILRVEAETRKLGVEPDAIARNLSGPVNVAGPGVIQPYLLSALSQSPMDRGLASFRPDHDFTDHQTRAATFPC